MTDKTFNCELCEYACSTNGRMNRHIKMVHDKIKDIECNQCEYTCSTNSDLKQHIKRVHDKIKDIKCNQCEYKCFRNGDLKKHIKAVHDQKKDIKCNQCDYTCCANGRLKQHIKAVHDRIKDIKCNQCEYTCSSNSNLKQHIKICTGGRVGSFGEVKIKDILDGLNINYIYNQTNAELSQYCGRSLRFDFEINMDEKTLFIEYDGRQHFEPIRFGGISEEQAYKNFKKQKRHDKYKNRFCNDNGYKLLRIPYTEVLHIEKHIIDFLKEHTTFGFEL